MKPTYRTKTPRAAFAVFAIVAAALVGLSLEELARYTASHAAQASLPQPHRLASAGN